MHLQPNIGSDRSWVWKVAADYSENPPTAETLAIRFANSTRKLALPQCVSSDLLCKPFCSLSPDAADFKAQFEKAQVINAGGVSVVPQKPSAEEPKPEETKAEEPAPDGKSAEKLEEAKEEKEKEAA
jgi:Ran-binding protein 1